MLASVGQRFRLFWFQLGECRDPGGLKFQGCGQGANVRLNMCIPLLVAACCPVGYRGGYKAAGRAVRIGTDDCGEGHAGGGVQGQWRDTPIPGQSSKYPNHFKNCLPSDKPHLKQTQYETNVIEESRVRLADDVNAVEEQITNH